MKDHETPASSPADMDRHIQQTVDRLQCIKQHLGNPTGFQGAARELLEWCSDTRAFQKPFEEPLISCLTTVSQVAAQPGYDLDLGYRLLAVCAAHRDKFTSKSAGMLSVWCEELGRLLLLRHQKSRTPESGKTCASSGMQMPQMQKPNMPPMAPSEPGGMQWQQGQHPTGQSLSVVTTVWGLSQTTQSGPFIQNTNGSGPGFTNTSMSTTPYSQPGQPYPTAAGAGPMGKGAASHMYPGNNPQQQVPQGPGGPMHTNPYNRPSSAPYNRPNGYPPTPTTPGTNPANGGPPPEALSAAALVAAAATATATATATAVMGMQERQQQQQQQQQQQGPQMNMNVNMNMNNQYPPQLSFQMSHQPYQQQFHGQQGRPPPHNPINMNMNMNMNMNHGGHPGGAGGPGMSAMGAQMSGAQGPMAAMQGPMGGKMTMGMYGGQRRMTPYPSPQQYMQNKRQQFPGPQQQFPNQQQLIRSQRPQLPNNNTKQVGYVPQYASSNPQGYVGGKPGVYPPTQQPLPSPTFGPGQPLRGPAPPYSQQNPYMNPHQMAPQPMRQPVPNPAYNNQFQQQQHSHSHSQQQSYPNHNMMYGQHSPLPGNPTPPMTPGSSVPPYLSPGSQDIKPNPADLKPPLLMRKENDELRLTFPVRDGVVLPPFRLEHNLAVSNHIFHLRESVFQTLMWRSDLELQLKCFHHEDRQMNTNWPASVTVSVNATPLHIERGENKTCHKPLYLKEVCAPGRNTIQITVTACCCSHLFVLQLVHRPSVRSVLQGLLRKRLLPAEHCITKIKRNFSNVAGNTNNHLSGSGEDSVEQTAVKMSLKCPITFRRIVLPARGHECKHIQCFDLESYLQLNCERGSWRCPVCNKTALLEGLEIDQYIWGILHSLANTDFEEVTIDQTASWKPVTGKPIKEEESDACGGSRWVKAMSPSSMTLPTMSSWDGFYNSQANLQQQPGTPQGAGRPHPMANSQGNNGMNHYNFDGSGAGGSLPDTNFQSAASDFLSPLSQMSENLGGSNSNIQKAMSGPMTPGSADTQHHSNSNNHSSNGPGSIEGQPLRHPTPAPGTPGSATPSSQANLTNHQSMSPACNSQPMGGAASGASNQASTPNNHHPASNNSTGDNNTSNHSQLATHNDLSSDLNFDPEAIIEGEGQGQESLDLLPENIGDPMELLSYLGPPDGSNANSNTTDDLLSLFDS